MADASKDEMQLIEWGDFAKVELRVGTIVRAEPFPEARRPAYRLWADFGPEIGERKASAQITVHYALDELVGKQVVGVVNFPPKQIGPIRSECLVTGFYDAGGTYLSPAAQEASAFGPPDIMTVAPTVGGGAYHVPSSPAANVIHRRLRSGTTGHRTPK